MDEANKKLKKMHVCKVGVMDENIGTFEEILVEAEEWADFNGLTIKQILDNRRGYLQRFNYCPDCGKKIDCKFLMEGL